MLAILNFGSLNIDMTYAVDSIVKPGQTVSSKAFTISCGGKGFNQSISLAKAGATVFHAGKVGCDGKMLVEKLKENNVDTSGITVSDRPNGHALIQVDSNGENSIILYGGSNQSITEAEIDKVFSRFSKDDMLLLQNEINNIPAIIRKAKKIGMKVAVNLAPISEDSFFYPLELVDLLIINETEGAALTGSECATDIVNRLASRLSSCIIVLTLGAGGVILSYSGNVYRQPAYLVETVDTTGAGDTFTGYFLESFQSGKTPEEAADWASKASALCVSCHGSSGSIPCRGEVAKASLRLRGDFGGKRTAQ
jgi:ribokinase